MNNTLIYPSQVVALAFGGKEVGVLERITPVEILLAEQRYVQPVFGHIYHSMLSGDYSEFVQDYIQPALALYVKVSILPSLALVQGVSGLAYAAKFSDTALADDELQELCRKNLKDANTLMLRAVNYVRDHSDEFGDVTGLKFPIFSGGIIL